MFIFLFLFFSMLLLCSFFSLKELFQVKNSVTTSLLFYGQSDKKKIMWLSRLEIGAAQIRSLTKIAPKSTVLMCEQKPYLVWFSCQHKSYLVSGYEHLSDMWLSSLEIGAARSSFAPLQKLCRNHCSYVWTESLSGMVFVPAQKLSGIRVWTPIRYVTLVFRDRGGAEQLRSLTKIVPKSLFLCVNRIPIWYGFRASTKAIWYSGNIALAGLGIALFILLHCRHSCLKAVSVWPSPNGEMRHVRKWIMITTKYGSR